MITIEQARTASEFWHMFLKNADGTPLRVRRSGKTQTWKTRPGQFRVPVKWGLRTSDYIQCIPTADNTMFWCVPEKWEVEHELFMRPEWREREAQELARINGGKAAPRKQRQV